ncbi:5-formyltetrahydrofolate cyclo-ligase [Anaerocolumna sp.]|uniref:5-formyltetrahydrofolate cyclo-ligase n=1 Tax=Anaerocolumna sp. TaxID=2041569 RepID=UPI0028AD4D5E|nr:5-formyltetrahydrofolate cyclo-ligase [Anaerocolumna sp.]
MNKKELRAHIKEAKITLSRATIQEDSNKITSILLDSSWFKDCSQLFCYVSFNQEIITTHIILTALEQSKKVAVPKIVDQEMKFFYIKSLGELEPGTLGILEPFSGEEAIPSGTEESLCIVPGLAFDRHRNRIGYGKGYYDKFFTKYTDKPIRKIALAFDFQIYENLPAEEYDKKVDRIITPTTIIE